MSRKSLFKINPNYVEIKFSFLKTCILNIELQVADNPFLGALATGDSASQKDKSKMEEFREKLERMKSGLEAFTIVLDDPAGNSYMQDLYLPGTSLSLK